jgi:hypothetical protein
MPYADTAAMNKHLAEIAQTAAKGAHTLLVIDGAGSYMAQALVVADNITLMRLPPPFCNRAEPCAKGEGFLPQTSQ